MQGMRLDGIIDSMDMNLSKIREIVHTGKPGVHGLSKSQTQFSDQTTFFLEDQTGNAFKNEKMLCIIWEYWGPGRFTPKYASMTVIILK